MPTPQPPSPPVPERTPRTDAFVITRGFKGLIEREKSLTPFLCELRDFARQLETELAAMTAELAEVQKRKIDACIAWTDAQDTLTAMTAERDKLRDEVGRYRAHCREKIYVDATPDAGLPERILSAHLDEGTVESNPAPLGELMNQWQAERNAIIRKAIADLAEISALRTSLSAAQQDGDALAGALAECDRQRLELIEGVCSAVSMVGTHRDEFCDEDPPEMSNGSPEYESLQTLRGHLEGTLIDSKTGDFMDRDKFRASHREGKEGGEST